MTLYQINTSTLHINNSKLRLGEIMENLMLYKLIILYMLDRTDEYTITNSQITNFILDKKYTGIFNIHEAISELIDKEFITATKIRNTQHYQITNLGEEALLYFENRISNTIKQEIRDYFKQEKINLKKESEITADYTRTENGEYTVTCAINERRDALLEVKMNVPTKEMARTICDNWGNRSTEIYQFMVDKLCTKD